jgi:hypothetical protein
VELNTTDRQSITELVALHGHLFDEGHLDRLDELFTPDVIYDVTDLGFPTMSGIAAIRDAALGLGAQNPVAHIVTNVVITAIDEGTASVRSKGLGLGSNGELSSVTYVDSVVRTADGWRIKRRAVLARVVPLGGRGLGSP